MGLGGQHAGLGSARALCAQDLYAPCALRPVCVATEESAALSSDHNPPAGVKCSTSSWACWGAPGRVGRYPPPPDTPLALFPQLTSPTPFTHADFHNLVRTCTGPFLASTWFGTMLVGCFIIFILLSIALLLLFFVQWTPLLSAIRPQVVGSRLLPGGWRGVPSTYFHLFVAVELANDYHTLWDA